MSEINTHSKQRAFTVQEAAKYAGVAYSTVRNWIADGVLNYEELPSRGNGGKRFVRIRRSDMDAFLNSYRN